MTDNRPSQDIDTFIVELEKELQEANRVHGIASSDYNDIRRAKLDLKQKMATIELEANMKKTFVDKARENIKRIESEIRIQKSNFWAAKNGGR